MRRIPRIPVWHPVCDEAPSSRLKEGRHGEEEPQPAQPRSEGSDASRHKGRQGRQHGSDEPGEHAPRDAEGRRPEPAQLSRRRRIPPYHQRRRARRNVMNKRSGNGKHALKDLTTREKHDVRGGTFTEAIANIKAAVFPALSDQENRTLAAAVNGMFFPGAPQKNFPGPKPQAGKGGGGG